MKKRSFLCRLVVIVVVGLFLPVVIFFNYFWDKSFEEMKKSSEIYYESLVVNFANNFHEKIADIKKHVASLIVEGKDAKSILWNGGELLKQEYLRYEVLTGAAYSHYYDVGDMQCGFYYYDLDLILYKGATMSSEQYIRIMLKVYEDEAEIIDCFDVQRFETDKIIFTTTANSKLSQRKLFVGYCTTLGKNHDKVMVFCLMDSANFNNVEKYINGYENVDLYILNKNTNVVYLELSNNTNNHNITDWGNLFSDNKDKMFKSVYQKDDDHLPLSFALSISEDSLQSNIVDFYHSMRVIIVVVALFLLLICAVSIYIVYKPIYLLTDEVGKDEIGEIESIRNALNDRRTKILEQEMLILDLLLNHLIYGVPLAAEKMVHLGIGKEMKHYCVILADGLSLLNSGIQQLTDKIESAFPVRAFMKEWEEEQQSVIIFFMKNKDTDDLERYIKIWVEEHSVGSVSLSVGNVVNRLDDIRASFLSSLKKREKASADVNQVKDEVKKLREQNEQQKVLKDDILAYIEIHYRDRDMSQTEVADHFRISNYTLSRLFKNQVGVGFTEYVNSKRLELAKELLLTTSYSVREISHMVGFSSDNYFYRLFKASMEISPTEFREK